LLPLTTFYPYNQQIPMTQITLTEPELSLIVDLAIKYQAKREASLAKATRKSPSAALESATLSTLISKLEAMHSRALAPTVTPETIEPLEPVVEQIHP
jgi:hypothetical protein